MICPACNVEDIRYHRCSAFTFSLLFHNNEISTWSIIYKFDKKHHCFVQSSIKDNETRVYGFNKPIVLKCYFNLPSKLNELDKIVKTTIDLNIY